LCGLYELAAHDEDGRRSRLPLPASPASEAADLHGHASAWSAGPVYHSPAVGARLEISLVERRGGVTGTKAARKGSLEAQRTRIGVARRIEAQWERLGLGRGVKSDLGFFVLIYKLLPTLLNQHEFNGERGGGKNEAISCANQRQLTAKLEAETKVVSSNLFTNKLSRLDMNSRRRGHKAIDDAYIWAAARVRSIALQGA